MARRLMQHGISDLEKLFSSVSGDAQALDNLAEELKHRHTSRAGALLAKVQRALQGAKPATSSHAPAKSKNAPATPSAKQQTLWADDRKSVPQAAITTSSARSEKPQTVITAVLAPQISAPSAPSSAPKVVSYAMGVDEAYKVLKATPGSTWDSIEQTRRQLVQQAHPEKIASQVIERRAQVQAEAKRANIAYAVLLQARASKSEC